MTRSRWAWGGRWAPQAEWSRDPGARKAAGVTPNHWYGCFPPAWLDAWGEENGAASESGNHWDLGRAHLSKISAAAVLGCQAVWRAATCLWRDGQRAREREREGGQRATSSGTCGGIDGGADDDPDVLETHNPALLNFMERKMYDKAVEDLHIRCESIRVKRSLPAEEKRIF